MSPLGSITPWNAPTQPPGSAPSKAARSADAAAPANLARHYEEANDIDRAVTYLQQAGDQAVQLSAHREAAGLYGRGLELIGALPATPERLRRELELQIGLATTLAAIKGYGADEVRRAHDSALATCLQAGDLPRLSTSLQLLNTYYGIAGQFATALEVGAQAVAVARQTGDATAVALAQVSTGWVRICTGEFGAALADLQPMVAIFDAGTPFVPVDDMAALYAASALAWTSWALWHLGFPDQARQRGQDALTQARRLDRGFSMCHALSVACTMLHLHLREFERAYEWSQEEIRLAVERGFPFYEAMGRVHQGWARAHLGEAAGGLTQMRTAMALADAIGARTFQAGYLGAIGEACSVAGEVGEGLAAVDEGLGQAEQIGEHWCLSDLRRVRGDLLLGNKPPDQAGAEAEYQLALQVARGQAARSLELRAALSLGQLWRRQGRGDEARALVQAIYEWFTEGFDTPDLVAARAFLSPAAIEPAAS